MSSGRVGDWQATKEQKRIRKSENPSINWLRHRINSQAAIIDEMILEGGFTIENIADRLNAVESKKYSITHRIRRINDHIAHLKDGVGDSRGKSHGMKPHDLKIRKNAQGHLSFEL